MSTHPPTLPPAAASRLDEAIEALLRAEDAGEEPTLEEWQSRYPDVAEELAAFFRNHQRVRDLTGADSRPRLQVGSRFGDYELLEIFTSGMGVVYRARQVSLDRLVALKMIRASQFASHADVQRFLETEAKTVASLDHPNIVPIYEVSEREGQHYFTMKFLDGGSLATRLADYRLPVLDARTRKDADGKTWSRAEIAERQSKIARVLVAVARAVHHAHQRQVLHRDLKPANILLDAAAQPCVVDFGLAKRVDAPGTPGTIAGTAPYMAPEQARGEKVLSTAVDVYGLGAVLYELLTGRPPFLADSVRETLAQVREQAPERPRQLNRSVVRDLEAICLKCLEKDPANRYGSAEAVAQELERYLANKPIRGRKTSSWEQFIKWTQRRPAVAALLGVVLVGIAAAGTYGVWRWFEREEALRKAQKDLYISDIDDAQRDLTSGFSSKARDKLVGCPEHLRAWEWRYLNAWCQDDEVRLRGHELRVLDIDYSRDGKRVATASFDGSVRVWDGVTGEVLHTFTVYGLPPMSSVSLSPDGSMVAAAGDDLSVRVWRLAEPGKVQVLRDAGKLVAFSPSGQWLAAGSSEVWLWSTREFDKPVRSINHQGFLTQIVFSPDDRWLVTAGFGKAPVRLWDLSTFQEVTSFKYPLDGVDAVAFTADSRQLATARRQVIQFWSVPGGDTAEQLLSYGGLCTALAVSPDGKSVAAAYRGSNQVTLWRIKDSAVLYNTPRYDEPVTRIQFSSDGERLVYTRGNEAVVVRWTAPVEPPFTERKVHREGICGISFSQSGAGGGEERLLASVSPDGRIVVFDCRNGNQVRELLELKSSVGALTSVALDARHVAAAAKSGWLEVWNVAEGARAAAFRAHEMEATSVLIAPDGHRLISASIDTNVRISELSTGALLDAREKHDDYVHVVALSAEGRQLAAAGEGFINIWDLRRKRDPLKILDGKRIWSIAFGPDGKLLASADQEGSIKLWAARSGQELRNLRGAHNGAAKSVAFHPDPEPDRQRLASGGEDGKVKLWDVYSGKLILTLEGPGSSVRGVAFSRDGELLAAGYADGTLRVWSAPIELEKSGR